MKICTTCHKLKPLDAFNLQTRAPDGRQPRCRDCCKAWYVANRERHMANTARRKRQLYAESYVKIRAHFAEHPCTDCGESDVRVLEFDHRPDQAKSGNISALIRAGREWIVIQAEIEKCDVRCANCHRRRTAAQTASWRDSAWREDAQRASNAASARLRRLFPQCNDVTS